MIEVPAKIWRGFFSDVFFFMAKFLIRHIFSSQLFSESE